MIKYFSILLSLLAVVSFTSCDSDDSISNEIAEESKKGILSLTARSIGLEAGAEFRLTIDGVDHVVQENEYLYLSAKTYHMTKFEIFENDVLTYYMVGDLAFEIFSQEVTLIQVPVIPVQEGNNGSSEVDNNGSPEFDIIIDPYHAIRNGYKSVVVPNTSEASTGVTSIMGLIDEGFPTIRLRNGGDSLIVFKYYQYGNTSNGGSASVDTMKDHYIVLPNTGTYIVEYSGKKKTITVQ